MDLLYLQALNSQLQGLILQRRREMEIIDICKTLISCEKEKNWKLTIRKIPLYLACFSE